MEIRMANRTRVDSPLGTFYKYVFTSDSLSDLHANRMPIIFSVCMISCPTPIAAYHKIVDHIYLFYFYNFEKLCNNRTGPRWHGIGIFFLVGPRIVLLSDLHEMG
jgi:hypothetical protein